MNEGDLQEAVIELAHLFKWRVAHFRAAKTDKGWRTPVAADGAGFPDLVLVRGETLMFVELKSEIGKLSIHQEVWKEDLIRISLPTTNVYFFVWRPQDWDNGMIEKQLR